jgi:membrane dipeptidase
VHRWGSYFRERWLPQLFAGGVDVQVLPVWIDDVYRPERALRQTLRMIEAAHRIAEHNADRVSLCLDGSDIEQALAGGRVALVLALESCPGIEADVELLTTVARLGVRVASLTHFGRSAFGDGSAEDATGSRLTSVGVTAVAELQRRGVIVDVSHLGRTGVDHVLELATRPVMATHSSARALCDHHRNLSDTQLRGVAGTGGVVCVNFYPGFIHDVDPSVARIVDHLEHIASVTGIDHVGIGPDFVAEVEQDITPPGAELDNPSGCDPLATIPGMTGPADLPAVTAELLNRGWPVNDVGRVLGGNVMRLFGKELGVAAEQPAR